MAKKLRQNKVLKRLSEAPLQAYLDNRFQLFDVMADILSEIGPADVYISTFSTSEEFLRRIYRFKKDAQIRRATMIIDLKATRKTLNLRHFIARVFDDCYLAENHSKVILLCNDTHHVSICTSQNQTRGNRYESGIVTTDPNVFNTLYNSYSNIVNNKSLQLGGLFDRTD